MKFLLSFLVIGAGVCANARAQTVWTQVADAREQKIFVALDERVPTNGFTRVPVKVQFSGDTQERTQIQEVHASMLVDCSGKRVQVLSMWTLKMDDTIEDVPVKVEWKMPNPKQTEALVPDVVCAQR